MTPEDKFELYYSTTRKDYGKLVVNDKVIKKWEEKQKKS